MIIRTYRCEDCGDTFDVTCESNDGDPDCPFCSKVLAWQPERFSIGTNKSRALDVTQQIIEQDYGLSDLNDNLREGDIAAKGPAPLTTSQVEAENRAMAEAAQQLDPKVKQFWGGGGPAQVNVGAAAMADARAPLGERLCDGSVRQGRAARRARGQLSAVDG